jgi:hypothetical protein
VIFTGYYAQAATLYRQLRDSGYTGVLAGGDGVLSPGILTLASASILEGVRLTGGTVPLSEISAEIEADFKKKMGVSSGIYAAESIDATNVLLYCIATGSLTRAEMHTCIDNYSGRSVYGHTFSFDVNGDNNYSAIYLYEIRQNELRTEIFDKRKLIPQLSNPNLRSDSISFEISNYDSSYTWWITTSAGKASRASGLVTVVGLVPGQSITVKIATSLSVKDASSAEFILRTEMSVAPTPTPTPTSAPKPSSQKPTSPTFSAVNIVGNTINVSVNLNSNSATKADSIYLVAPSLGITLAKKFVGKILGDKASWNFDFDRNLAGKSIPLEVIASNGGVQSNPLSGTFDVPALPVASNVNTKVPASPTNPEYKVVGQNVIVFVDAPTQKGATAKGAYLTAPALRINSGNRIKGKVANGKATFSVPMKASMAGKTTAVSIYLTNEIGDSKPLSGAIKVPSIGAGIKPNLPTKTTSKPVPTVICQKGNQTRTFVSKSCPPGWK